MKMRALHVLALGFGLTLGLTSCPSGGGGGGGSSMAITSCTLGCSTGGGTQVSCGVTDVYVNQEIRITFTDPVWIDSVTNSSFQVTDIDTGKTPPSSFSVDADNPHILIYRPQLTFDSSGNPIFGLTAGATYTFKIPGQSLDPAGPFIENLNGTPNQNRLLCTLVASRGIFDANPGPPSVAITVDVRDVDDADGDGNTTETFVADAQGAENVAQETLVTMVFDDIMNPGTLANPVTGRSNTITVMIDPDGDTTDDTDQLELAGTFSISIDQDALITTVIFTPDGGLPSGGQADPKRKVVMVLPEAIKDLGGNSLENAGNWEFTPEEIVFAPYDIVESFDSGSNEDEARTGSNWNSAANPGLLIPGSEGQTASGILGGGSGRLGDLTVPTGKTVVLDTDSEDFATIYEDDVTVTDPEDFDIDLIIDSAGILPITDGIFEFSSVRIDAGGTLRLKGSKPARIYARGELVVQGLLDVSGTGGTGWTADNQPALTQHGFADAGGVGGLAGPGGGIGGDGGMRPDGENFTGLAGRDGVDNPLDPVLYTDVDGKAGMGIPWPDTLSTTDFVAEGEGGVAWPYNGPGGDLYFPADPNDIFGQEYDTRQQCRNRAAGGAGGGGGFALDGLEGESFLTGTFGDPAEPPPDTPGGRHDELLGGGVTADDIMGLDPDTGFLRGGSGGGGAGGHLQATRTNGTVLSDCYDGGGGTPTLFDFYSHSSAAGGGAGGGLQIQTGRRIVVNGVVDASGGNGGNNDTALDSFASPGGGGAGGGLLLQSRRIQVQTVPGRFDLRGGFGGVALDNSHGGIGSPGILRLETFLPTPDIQDEEQKVLPEQSYLDTHWPDYNGVGVPAQVEDFFSIDVWNPQPVGPNARSGAQSCWFKPPGNYFRLEFAADDDPNVGDLGWDMTVDIAGWGSQSWRGENDIYPGVSLEEQFGNDLGTSPLVVRFMGARILGTLDNACNVDLYGADSPVQQQSRSGWVKHPADLNLAKGTATVQPNMIRFAVIWDATQPNFPDILAIEEITIRVQRD